MSIRSNVKNVVNDWVMAMDSTVPVGVNSSLYKHLKYSNREKVIRFLDEHPEYSKDLLYKLAVHEFMKKSDEEKVKRLNLYMEKV